MTPAAPTEPTATAVADPVEYDPVAEAERLSRTDALLAADETRRDQRIDDEEAAARQRERARREQAQRAQRAQIILLEALCGRG